MATGGAMTSALHTGGGVEGRMDAERAITDKIQEGKLNAKTERDSCCSSMCID